MRIIDQNFLRFDFSQVDDEIMEILRDRVKECFTYHGGWYAEHAFRLCEELQKDAMQAEINFKIKCESNIVFHVFELILLFFKMEMVNVVPQLRLELT